LKPIQTIELAENLNGEIDWPVQYVNCRLYPVVDDRPLFFSFRVYNFNNVSVLTMYICENYGADKTRIYYIGLKGEFTQVHIP